MSKIRFDGATPADFPALMALYQSIMPHKMVGENELNAPQARSWCLFAGNVLIGFVLAWEVLDELQIIDMGVDAAWRRQGMGRAMLNDLIVQANKSGTKRITLEVSEKNFAAIALYRHAGFTNLGRRRAYYADGGDALLMDLAIFD